MLFKIQTVAQSAAGRTYARDIMGRTFFPQNQDMELQAGWYGFAVETIQTKGKNVDTGELEDLAEPRKILQITAAFHTKEEAIEAAAEVGTLGAEVQAEVVKTAKTLNLSEENIKQLANAAF